MKFFFSKAFCSRAATILLCALISCGCGQYKVSLNNQELYQPPQIAKITQVADINLKNCIEQTLADNKVTELHQLERLSCTYAGIESLNGLQQLSGLKELNISDNDLQDILAIFDLENLTTLHLRNNPKLKCSQLRLLRGNSKNIISISPPGHCEEN